MIAARILGTPGAPRLLAAAFVGRLPIGMTGLALLLLVRDASGSYALAGACAGAFALAEGVCSPLQGRAIDRAGIARVLLPCAALYAAALAGVIAAAATGAPAAALLALSAVAGAGLPILSSVTRALWPRLLPDPALVAAAYSLETVVQSATWIGGALLVAALVALASPGAALLAAAALAVAGTLGVAGAAVARHDRARARAGRATGPLADPGVRTILAGIAGVGLTGGAIDVALVAVGGETGAPALAGVLLAALSAGVVAGGLVGGRGGGPGPEDVHARRAAVFALACAPLPLAAGRPILLVLLVLAVGVALAPLLAGGYLLVGRLAAAGATTEAFAWTSTAFGGGVALGSALAGPLTDAGGSTAALALAAACAAAGALAVAARRATLLPAAPRIASHAPMV